MKLKESDKIFDKMSLPAVLNRHNTSGFCKLYFKAYVRHILKTKIFHLSYEKIDQSPISKVILGTLATCHVGLNLAMFSNLPKYLICKLPGKILFTRNKPEKDDLSE